MFETKESHYILTIQGLQSFSEKVPKCICGINLRHKYIPVLF